MEFGRSKSDGDIGAVVLVESCIGTLADTVVEDTIAAADCILDDVLVHSFVGGDHNVHNIVGDVDVLAAGFDFVGDTFDAVDVVDHHALCVDASHPAHFGQALTYLTTFFLRF